MPRRDFNVIDRDFSQYIQQGLAEGFRIGYNYSHSAHRSSTRNMLSSGQNPEVVDRYVEKEVKLGQVNRPLWCGQNIPRWSMLMILE